MDSPFFGIPSFIDSGIFAAQIGQIALYSLDGITREDSNQMWLRKAAFTRSSAPRKIPKFEGLCIGEIVSTSKISHGNVCYRTIDMNSKLENIQVTYTLAHQISMRAMQ
jgi:hypothetical protein